MSICNIILNSDQNSIELLATMPSDKLSAL